MSKPKVAVLLATYNGSRFIETQLKSLAANETAFVVNWLDDHSTDDTRSIVRSAASRFGIELCECHHANRLKIPGAYFQLLECVDADIYLFCDQDDIWQPAKIDATVAYLQTRAGLPALCYSAPLIFFGDECENIRTHAEVTGSSIASAREESLFTWNPAIGHTVGFTRPLRDTFVKHKDIARECALMHDWWMCIIARASGAAQMLSNVPTTLYRQHGGNAVGVMPRRLSGRYAIRKWRTCQAARRMLARQAEGFLKAYPTLQPGQRVERVVSIARLVAALPRRKTPADLLRLLRSGALVSKETFFWYSVTCLIGDAPVNPQWRPRWESPAKRPEGKAPDAV